MAERKCPVCGGRVCGGPLKIFCSKRCWEINYRRKKKSNQEPIHRGICPVCGNDIFGHASKKYCSRKCHLKVRAEATRKYQQKLREKNIDIVREKARIYRENNRDKIREQHRKQRMKDREKRSERQREYYRKNRDKYAIYLKKYRERNRQKKQEQATKRKQNKKALAMLAELAQIQSLLEDRLQ